MKNDGCPREKSVPISTWHDPFHEDKQVLSAHKKQIERHGLNEGKRDVPRMRIRIYEMTLYRFCANVWRRMPLFCLPRNFLPVLYVDTVEAAENPHGMVVADGSRVIALSIR